MCSRSYLHHGPGAGGKLSDTWRQKNGSIDWGSHLFFYPDEQRYGSGSSQIQGLCLREDLAPSLSFPHQKWIPRGRSHILPCVSTCEEDRKQVKWEMRKKILQIHFRDSIFFFLQNSFTCNSEQKERNVKISWVPDSVHDSTHFHWTIGGCNAAKYAAVWQPNQGRRLLLRNSKYFEEGNELFGLNDF